MSSMAPGLVLLVTCSTTQVNSLRLREVKRQHAKCHRPTISRHPYFLSQHDFWRVEEWFFLLGAIYPGTINLRPTADVLENSLDVTVPSKACVAQTSEMGLVKVPCLRSHSATDMVMRVWVEIRSCLCLSRVKSSR